MDQQNPPAAAPLLFEEQRTQFAEVAVPLPLPGTFTYRVPPRMEEALQPGARVVVQFGRRKILTGLIVSIHHRAPEKYQAKYLLELLDPEPLIGPPLLKLFGWIADYYVSSIGEVMNAALPAGLKISSQSRLQRHPEFDPTQTEHFSPKERLLMTALAGSESLSFEEAAQLLDVQNIHHVLNSLIRHRAVVVFEEVQEKYKPKFERRVRLPATVVDTLEAVFEQLEKQPKQVEVLLTYLQQVAVQDADANHDGLAKKALTDAGRSASSVATLVRNGILEEFDAEVSRLPHEATPPTLAATLSEDQARARDQIAELFRLKSNVLFHGVTGSGKTQVYVELIRQALAGGSQVLLMLPEIAITTQIVERLRKVFGTRMAVYHSRFSDNERVEVWKGVATGEYSFVVGVRSAVFLPFDNLGLIVVDEEHETSYKQFDPAPRYHARDVAVVLGQLHGARVLLGSATPSVEAFYQTQTGRWGLVQLLRRYGEAQLPEITFADTKRARKFKTIRFGFTDTLEKAVANCLSQEEQAIIFQNRRGYAPYISCSDCEWIPRCQHCDVSLTYHQHNHSLRCHYCGFHFDLPQQCPDCGSKEIKTFGYGTEKIEEHLGLLLPECRVRRMDLDTTRTKNSHEGIIRAFEAHEVDVLVGTQMVTKGLDFEKVSLVGIFDADRMLYYPDFRANERAFQMITQVSGRAGRREKRGVVVIQTSNPEAPILDTIQRSDYESMYQEEISEREQFGWPPFSRLIRVTAKAQDRRSAVKAAVALGQAFGRQLGVARVLGPEAPLVERIRSYYLQNVLLKLERDRFDLGKVKRMVRAEIDQLAAAPSYKHVKFVIDVDPA